MYEGTASLFCTSFLFDSKKVGSELNLRMLPTLIVFLLVICSLQILQLINQYKYKSVSSELC